MLKTIQPIGDGTPTIAQINRQGAGCWCCHQDTRIQELEEDGSQRDGGAALQGRRCGIRGFVGQLCGERRHVQERWSASEWQGGSSFCRGTVRGGRQRLG